MSIKKVIIFFSMLLFVGMSYGENYEFKSYHIYSTDDDKYIQTNELSDSSKICIDETNQEIELSLYNREVGKWMVFNLKINYRVTLGFKSNIGTLYFCTNNLNQTCSVCVCNNDEGTFIDFHNFYIGEKPMCCWVKSEKE